MKKFISKSIMSTILCMMIVAGICTSNIDGFAKEKNDRYCMLVSVNQVNPQVGGDGHYCKDCGRSEAHIIADALLKRYNVYFINRGQQECNDYANNLISNSPFIYSNHTNIETGQNCKCILGMSTSTEYKKHSYYEEYETPVVNMK